MVYKTFTIGDLYPVHYSLIAFKSNELTYLSIVGNDKTISLYEKNLNKNNTFRIDRRYIKTSSRKYDIFKKKIPNSSYTHMIAAIKDNIDGEEGDNPTYNFETFVSKTNEEQENVELTNQFYNKIYKLTPIPVLKEWVPYILENLRLGSYAYSLNNSCFTNDEDNNMKIYSFSFKKKQLLDILKIGLEQGDIKIKENARKSVLIDTISGLDSYLNIYGEILADKIQNSFTPKYNYGQDYYEYVTNYTDYCYHKGMYLYDAQINAIQACTNHLKQSNEAKIVGEMGVGKTAIASGIAYSLSESKVGSLNAVLCPSHLTSKWKREIEMFVPNGKAYIVSEIQDLIDIYRKKDIYKRIQHTFIIISKESSKLSYEEVPSAIYNKRTKKYYCPKCGQLLTKTVKDKKTGEEEEVPLTYMDLLKKKKDNITCNNRRRDVRTKKYIPCNEKIWSAYNKDFEHVSWIKFGKYGWINEEQLYDLLTILQDKEEKSKFEKEILREIEEYALSEDKQSFISKIKAPRRYPIAKFIRKHMQNKIDLFIVDECHQYKGLSEQGKAMFDISLSSKKTLCLTGTLVNGYADGIFYLLYRTNPKLMKKEGFEFNDYMSFVRTYGVIEKTTSYFSNSKNTNEKKLPGVSPLVFTKFLLENTLFLSLSDMDGGLPSYEEIPIGVDMSTDQRTYYRNVESFFASEITQNWKLVGTMFRSLTSYPDYPFDYPDALDPVTGEVVYNFPSLNDDILPKEQELIDLIKEKKNNGEKTLLYVESIHKVMLIERLVSLLESEGINTEVLTSKVKASTREDWIANNTKDIDVLICNPKLVETGLDLLDFTNIVFFQMGDNLYVMRQASRRSYRLSQTKDIKVYFFYYKDTFQERTLSLMATKLQSSMAIEGKFNEEGLAAMSNNLDILTAIASSVVEGIKNVVDVNSFCRIERSERTIDFNKERVPLEKLLFEKIKITHLEFLEKKRQEKKKEKSLNKTMKEFFNNTASIVNYY